MVNHGKNTCMIVHHVIFIMWMGKIDPLLAIVIMNVQCILCGQF